MFWLAVGALAIAASFAPLYRFQIGQAGYAPSGWAWNTFGLTANRASSLGAPTLYGVPVVVSAALVLLAGAFAFRSALRIFGVLAAGLLAGTGGTVVFLVATRNGERAATGVRTAIEAGTWLLVSASVLGLIGASFVLHSFASGAATRAETWASSVDVSAPPTSIQPQPQAAPYPAPPQFPGRPDERRDTGHFPDTSAGGPRRGPFGP